MFVYNFITFKNYTAIALYMVEYVWQVDPLETELWVTFTVIYKLPSKADTRAGM
jgi:hypothetical protein